MEMRTAVARKVGAPLAIESMRLAAPRARQVLLPLDAGVSRLESVASLIALYACERRAHETRAGFDLS